MSSLKEDLIEKLSDEMDPDNARRFVDEAFAEQYAILFNHLEAALQAVSNAQYWADRWKAHAFRLKAEKPRCEQCLHWEKYLASQRSGLCQVREHREDAGISTDFGEDIWTYEDFGCVQWEKKS